MEARDGIYLHNDVNPEFHGTPQEGGDVLRVDVYLDCVQEL